MEHGIVEIYINMNGQEVVLERLFRGSVINYKNIFSKSTAKMNLRFAAESVVKSLSLSNIKKIRKHDNQIHKAIQKYVLKVSRIPAAPLDYILVLPKKVNAQLIDRTRERMLFDKQDELMESLQEKKDYHKKYHGLHMDDQLIAKTLKQI